MNENFEIQNLTIDTDNQEAKFEVLTCGGIFGDQVVSRDFLELMISVDNETRSQIISSLLEHFDKANGEE